MVLLAVIVSVVLFFGAMSFFGLNVPFSFVVLVFVLQVIVPQLVGTPPAVLHVSLMPSFDEPPFLTQMSGNAGGLQGFVAKIVMLGTAEESLIADVATGVVGPTGNEPLEQAESTMAATAISAEARGNGAKRMSQISEIAAVRNLKIGFARKRSIARAAMIALVL